jgi:hypothetical protein
MDKGETIVDIVDRLDRSVSRLEKLLDGDVQLGLRGIAQRVTVLEEHVAAMQSVRVSALQWLLGYLLFGLFVVLVSHSNCLALGLPLSVGMTIGALAFVLAAVFFVSGLGWIRWR